MLLSHSIDLPYTEGAESACLIGLWDRKKIKQSSQVDSVVTSSFNLLKCCGIGVTLWHWRP